MRQMLIAIAGVVVSALAIASAIASSARAQENLVPLYDDLGNYHLEISSSVPQVQEYFNQGVRLYYAFNHAEGIRAFREAQRLDPECAICWWGEALAWGPNINLPMDRPSALAAYTALGEALDRIDWASPKEQALIRALAVRYSEEAPDNRARLDQAYANAMANLVLQYPADLDISVLYAEALMDLRPWDYWTEQGQTKPGIDIALQHLQATLAANANHPGACHFYIHAVEAVYPERAVACAERLAELMPGAGHLVHMPGHIYIRVGRYLDAVTANQHAVHADETYIQDHNPGMGMYTVGYYPHNYDFLAFAAMMIGQSKTAVDSARQVTALLPREMFGAYGMDFLQHWLVRPLQMHVRFAQWDEILQVESPPQEFKHALGIWHYARGRAFLATGEHDAALQELAKLHAIIASGELGDMKMEFNRSEELLSIAECLLSGWSSAAKRDFDAAIAAMEEAVQLESQLFYGEPPEWSVPTRQELGAVLLKAGRYGEAERVFREDLAKFPENGWSLYGAIEALRAQGKTAQASELQTALDRVWATADVDLAAMF